MGHGLCGICNSEPCECERRFVKTHPTADDVPAFLRELTALCKRHNMKIEADGVSGRVVVESWNTGRSLAVVSLFAGNYIITRRIG